MPLLSALPLATALLAGEPATSPPADGWIDIIASASRDVAHAVVAAEDGGVISAGGFSTHLASGPAAHRLFNRGGYDVFVSRNNPDGQRRWLRTIGGPGKSVATDLAANHRGEACVAGSFTETVGGIRDAMPQFESHGATDALIACMDAEGQTTWARRFGGKRADSMTAIEATDNGWLAGGDYAGTFPLHVAGGADPLVMPRGGERSGWLLALSEHGEVTWSHTFNGTGAVSVRDVMAGAEEEMLVLLRFSGALVLQHPHGHAEYRAHGASDLLVLALDRDGISRWVQRIHGPGAEDGAALAAGADGQIAIAGSFVDELYLGERTLQSQGSSDAFVVTLTSAGEIIAAHRFGADQADIVYDIVGAPRGWYLSSTFIDHTDFGSARFVGNATTALISELDEGGGFRTGLTVDGEGLEQITRLAALPCNRLAAVGQFNGTLDGFNAAAPLKPLGKLDAFARVLPRSGPQQPECSPSADLSGPEARRVTAWF